MSQTTANDPSRNLSDSSIISMYWDRNENAIKATDEKYGKYLYTISYNILKNKLDSEECINDTYLTTWNRIPPERPNVLQRFLSKITRDISVDRYRKTHAMKQIPSEMMVSLEELEACVDSAPSADNAEAAAQISAVLNTFLHKLSQRERFIFICRYYYADPVQDIARMLEVSDKTIYRELADIRAGLREALGKEGISV